MKRLKITRPLSGGTYFQAYIYKDVNVVKFSPTSVVSLPFWHTVFLEFKRLRHLVIKNKVPVPKLIRCMLATVKVTSDCVLITRNMRDPSIILLEKFAGPTVRDLLRTKRDKSAKMLNAVESFIKRLPENIPLDVHPGNIAIDSAGKISLIDFFPPDPWFFSLSPEMRNMYIQVFPTCVATSQHPNSTYWYLKRDGRLERFAYHVGLLLSSVTTQTS